MKINKLFHWLYAILMLLPIFAIGVTCAYTIFNKNAYLSYDGLNENTQSNILVDSVDDFDYSQTYFLGNSQLDVPMTSNGSSAYFYFSNVEVINNNTSYDLSQVDRVYIYLAANSATIYYNFSVGNTGINLNSGSIFLLKVNVRTISGGANAITTLNYALTHSSTMYYIDYFTYQQLDNVFYYSLDKMKANPLFSWANNNFLTNPFSYLFNLFGVPTNSGIMTLLSYWLDISIIWLVFDLIMYVPLLAHRWIDKGVIS